MEFCLLSKEDRDRGCLNSNLDFWVNVDRGCSCLNCGSICWVNLGRVFSCLNGSLDFG